MIVENFSWRFSTGIVLLIVVAPELTYAYSLKVKVIKACQDCTLTPAESCRSTIMHRNKAGSWTPDVPIRIHAVSIPEQSEAAIYTDIEVSTAEEMYQLEGHIFREKYAGPGIIRDPPCPVSFSGSNITTTNIVFPSGSWIDINQGQAINVHMDVINWTPYEISPMAQDVYIYYSEVKHTHPFCQE
jgi:hypothetical protein